MATPEQLSMTDILDDKPAEKPEPEAPAPDPAPDPAAETAAKEAAEEARQESYKSKRKQARDKEAIAQGKVRDPDTGQFVAPKAEPEVKAEAPKPEVAEPPKPAVITPPQQEMTSKERAAFAKAAEETRKRQALERTVQELQARLPQEPAKTFWDDPEAALKASENRVRAETTKARVNMAEFSAKQRHPDFSEKAAVFAQIMEQMPGPQQQAMAQEWLASPDPAEFAYLIGKNHMEMKAVGSMEEYKAKIERDTAARVRAEVEAEHKAKADKLAADRAALPPSLSDARATGGVSKPVWNGPPSMEDILK